MPLDLSGLENAVSAETTEVESFVALFKTIKQQLNDELAGNTAAQAKVNAFMDTLISNSQKMVDAANANVP